MRIVNDFFKSLRRSKPNGGWSYAQESEAMGLVISKEALEQHDENDSSNGHIISLRCELYLKKPLPCRPSNWWPDGRICREVAAETLEIWGEDYKIPELARAANRKFKLNLDRAGLISLGESMRNVFRGRIMDSFTIAVINGNNSKPTLPPYWFLKREEPKPKQLKLAFGQVEVL